MRKLHWELIFVAVAIGFGFCAPVSKAETVIANLTGLVPLAGGDLYVDGTKLPDEGVGQFQWNGAGFGNSAPFGGTFSTYCLDVLTNINLPDPGHPLGYTYTFLLQPDLAAAPTLAASGSVAAAFKSLEIQFLYLNYLSTGDLQAFQLALWNIIYDTDQSVDPGEGNFYVEDETQFATGVISDADSYLSTVNADALAYSGPLPVDPNVYALVGQDGAQSQVFFGIIVGSGTPLPASALGGGALLAGLAIFRCLRSWRRTGSII